MNLLLNSWKILFLLLLKKIIYIKSKYFPPPTPPLTGGELQPKQIKFRKFPPCQGGVGGEFLAIPTLNRLPLPPLTGGSFKALNSPPVKGGLGENLFFTSIYLPNTPTHF